MIRRNTGAALALAAILGIPGTFTNARAAAIVHRFNLELGAGFTSIAADNYNQQLDYTNIFLTSRGLQGLDHITYSFLYDAGVRFFVKPSFAVRAGVGQLRNQTKREYLPAIHQDINIRSEVFSIPIFVGGDYYFAPYNQGDFQARAFMGGGLMSQVTDRVTFQSYESGTDNTTTIFGTTSSSWQRDAPGWYGELGVHMFFAMRYSVVINAYYRSAKMNALYDTKTKEPFLNPSDGQPFDLDLSGMGARMALCIGL